MNFVRIDGWPDYVIHPNGVILRLWPKSRRNPKGCSREIKHKIANGYMRVCLCENSIKKYRFVHRLLAKAFIPNPENKPYVDHIRGKHIGNSLDNLRWATAKENSNGFTSNPAAIITKGCICKRGNGYQWRYNMSAINKSKYMKSLDALEKYRDETIKKYLI